VLVLLPFVLLARGEETMKFLIVLASELHEMNLTQQAGRLGGA